MKHNIDAGVNTAKSESNDGCRVRREDQVCKAQFVPRRLAAIATLLAAALWGNQLEGKSNALVKIVAPVSTGQYPSWIIEARIRLEDTANPSTFRALLNGRDVTSAFDSRWSSNERLEIAHFSPNEGLRPGRNVLQASVKDRNQNLDVVSEEFVQGQSELLGASGSVEPPYAVSLNTTLNNAGQTGIAVGPQPGSPDPTSYNQFYANQCAAGSVQIMVLDSQYLTPAQQNVPNGAWNTCQTAANATNFLKTIPTGLLVIGSSSSNMTSFDASAIGGSKQFPSSPSSYQVIGIAGVSGGAYESFTGKALNGSLMRGNDGTYFFAPANYTEFAVTPNDPGQGGLSSIVIGQLFVTAPPSGISNPLTPQPGTTYVAPAFTGNDAGAAGGFWVLLLDRRDLSVISSTSFGTNHPGGNGDPSRAAMDALTKVLSAPGDQLIFLTSINSPLSSERITGTLAQAVEGLGGNRYIVDRLSSVDGNAKQAIYTLVGSTDGSLPYDQKIEASPLIAGQNQTGVVRGVMGPDRQNLFAPVHAERQAEVTFEGITQPNAPVNFDFYSVIYAQPASYPAWSDTTQASYYASASGVMTQTFSSACVTNPGNSVLHCDDVRYYYNQGNPPGSLVCGAVVPATLSGVNPNDPDWLPVQNELKTEHAWVCSVESEYNDVKDLATDTAVLNLNLSNTLSNAAQDVQSFSQNAQPPLNLKVLLNSKALSRWSALLPTENITKSLLADAPDIGPVFGLGSAVFSTVSVFFKKDPVSSAPNEQFESTLGTLNNDVDTYGPAVAASALTLFRHILADYEKLRVFGSNYSAFIPGWNGDCTEFSTCVAPSNALPLFQVGAKRYFYSQLLPNMYSMDVFWQVESDIHQPGNIGGLEGHIEPSCESAYYSAPGNSQLPPYQDSVWAYYQSVGTGPSGGNDFFIMTKTPRTGSWPSNYNYVVYPSSSVMTKLTSLPAGQTTSPQNPGLAGGLLFSPDYLFSTHAPASERPGTISNPSRGICNTSGY